MFKSRPSWKRGIVFKNLNSSCTPPSHTKSLIFFHSENCPSYDIKLTTVLFMFGDFSISTSR